MHCGRIDAQDRSGDIGAGKMQPHFDGFHRVWTVGVDKQKNENRKSSQCSSYQEVLTSGNPQ